MDVKRAEGLRPKLLDCSEAMQKEHGLGRPSLFVQLLSLQPLRPCFLGGGDFGGSLE